MTRFAAALPLLLLAACNGQPDDLPGGEDPRPYAGIAESDRLRFTGTEPFWGGEVRGTTLRFSTAEEPEGRSITVTRFAGRGGASWSGELAGAPFTLLASEGACSDGMSDRSYPFTVTVQNGEQLLSGCGWTDARPFTGSEAP
ncbi:COG3650 family protein [Croceibacterium ferulae]|uniref:COG3650 family protein n=1 Tax=Croceibacterium ferulae TaxID=1854641 RepID=UPI001F4E9B72|nr:hypothetical protein [Croceibacterium ferulae]